MPRVSGRWEVRSPFLPVLSPRLFVAWFFGGLLGAIGIAFGQPAGGVVVAGSATLGGSPGSLVLTQTSARAIVEWQDFSLGAGQSMRFVQPDALSATLNRVVSNLPSS